MTITVVLVGIKQDRGTRKLKSANGVADYNRQARVGFVAGSG
jgi:hypothetical protein